MPTMTTPQEIAAAIDSAIDGGGHLVIRFAHSQMRQLKAEEVELLVASLKASQPEGEALILFRSILAEVGEYELGTDLLAAIQAFVDRSTAAPDMAAPHKENK